MILLPPYPSPIPGRKSRAEEGHRSNQVRSSLFSSSVYVYVCARMDLQVLSSLFVQEEEWTPNPFFLFVVTEVFWASCKNPCGLLPLRKGQHKHTTVVTVVDMVKGSKGRGQIFFYTSQILADHFFYEPFFFHSNSPTGDDV